MKKQMIKRKDGSYSQRGLWDNVRANRGSGKKPTPEMLKQERKIKAKMEDGGINNPGFKALPSYVQAKIKSNMQEGGVMGPMSAVSAIVDKSSQPMMQMGGMMPQTSAGQSVLKEAMMMSQMQEGGKMPNEIAKARFMAAAKGNIDKAKETASKYGYSMQGGGMNFGGTPNMKAGTPGFNFQQASAAAVADPTLTPPSDIERMGEVDITKKRSFGEKVAGKYRQAKKALGMSPYSKTQAEQGREAVFAQGADERAKVQSVFDETAATNKKQNRNQLQRVGDEFGTYLNLSGDRNVLTDLADIGTAAASAVGMNSTAAALQSGKRTVQDFGNTKVAKAIDYINPLSIGANLVAGAIGTTGDVAAGENTDAMKRAGMTTALAATRGIAGRVSGAAAMPVGKAFGKVGKSKLGHSLEHQLGHAGQHQLLSPLLAHKNGGTIRDTYMMKKGGQFPERYKKMGFSGVDKPKRTTSGGKSHAVVTKVDGNYKLIRFGQKGVSGSPDGSARNKAFKARHAKNIAKGKSSAAYWANKIKW
jgi:hypothetical protein